MKITGAEVSHSKRFPTGRYRTEGISVSLRIEIDSDIEDAVREIFAALAKAKQIVEVQERQAKLDVQGRTEI